MFNLKELVVNSRQLDFAEQLVRVLNRNRRGVGSIPASARGPKVTFFTTETPKIVYKTLAELDGMR